MLTLEALKLATTGDDLPRVEQALLDMANKGHEARATLRSTYYDTVAGRLRREGVVLCVHEQDRRYIQTVKTDGVSGTAFRRRGEWEDVIGAEQPDLDAPNSGPVCRQAFMRPNCGHSSPRSFGAPRSCSSPMCR